MFLIFRSREKEILLEENRALARELKLKEIMIENFIPANEVKKFQERLQFSEENFEWMIQKV